jgi:pyruvate carboxylase
MRRKAAGHSGPLTKILVANRGVSSVFLESIPVKSSLNRQEIAIRVFRTAHELAMHTVAIYSFEDRLSAHRQKVRRRHRSIFSLIVNYLVR